MKLSCVRCKQKKIKCDKESPRCNRCKTADAQCTYVERRQRARTTQPKRTVNDLNRRVEDPENHVDRRLLEPSSTSPLLSTPTSTGVEDSESTPEPEQELSGSDSKVWIYRLASNAKHSINELNTQGHLTEADPSTPQNTYSVVDNAIDTLNSALHDLEHLKIRPHYKPSSVDKPMMTSKEARQCLNNTFELFTEPFFGDFVNPYLQKDLMLALPSIIDSPYIQIDPVAKVSYHNLMFYGQSSGSYKFNNDARLSYYKCLQSVPAWLESAKGTELDLVTASLTTWTAINNFDYHLAWKFHCKACHFTKQLGIDKLDAIPAATYEEDKAREPKRAIYWYIVETELLFRLYYDKPSIIDCSTKNVKLLGVTNPDISQPKANVTMRIVSVRMISIVIEFCNFLDSYQTKRQTIPVAELEQKINESCDQLEEMMDDWDVIAIMKRITDMATWTYVDRVLTVYTLIIQMERRKVTEDTFSISPRTLKAARIVLDSVVYLEERHPSLEKCTGLWLHFVTFYPFCAFFSLYQHIITSCNPEDCEGDIDILEKLSKMLEKACSVRTEFIPISNVIKALNKVSKAIQDGRRRAAERGIPFSPGEATASVALEQQQQQQLLQQQQQQQAYLQSQGQAMSFYTATPIDQQPATLWQPFANDWAGFGFPLSQDYNNVDMLQPLGLMKAVEDEFTRRNWHEDWWDMSGANVP